MTHTVAHFPSPVNLPKETKINEFDKLFESPIIQVDLTTGTVGGCGLEAAWERGRHRVQDKPLPEPVRPAPDKQAFVDKRRKYSEWTAEEVLQAWEDSGHNKAKAARLMRVHETTYRQWLKQVLPEVFDGKRRRK